MIALLACVLLVDQTSPAPSDDAASLRRIREKLAKPAASLVIKPPTPEPTFKVEVQQHPYFTEIPFVWTFSGGGVPATQRSPTGQGQPLFTIDLLPWIKKLARPKE